MRDLDRALWEYSSERQRDAERMVLPDNEIWDLRAQSGRLGPETGVDRQPSSPTEGNIPAKSVNTEVVLRAYSTVDERGELPSTYVSRTPRTFYVPKPGKKPSSGLKEDYTLYDFEIFRPYVKEVRRDSQGIYYALRDEFMPLLSEFKSKRGDAS
jgi:hypothetical protein